MPTIVQDGAPERWMLVEAWLEREGFAATAKLIDRFHVHERSRSAIDRIFRRQ